MCGTGEETHFRQSKSFCDEAMLEWNLRMKLQGSRRKSVLGRGNGTCKGPEVGKKYWRIVAFIFIKYIKIFSALNLRNKGQRAEDLTLECMSTQVLTLRVSFKSIMTESILSFNHSCSKCFEHLPWVGHWQLLAIQRKPTYTWSLHDGCSESH